MARAVLIVSSTRVHADPQEILRIQDTASALLEEGFSVDLLVPRTSPLLLAALASQCCIYTIPNIIPFCEHPPARPSLRRYLVAVLMFFHAVALATRRGYAALHGFNDGALVVRSVDRATMRRMPYVTEIHAPLTRRGFFKGPRGAFAASLERSALRHAAAIVFPSESVRNVYGCRIPKARVMILPDPHVELVPETLTVGEFNLAIARLYAYILRPRFSHEEN